MTRDDFYKRADEVAHTFLGRMSTPTLGAEYKNAISQLVFELYQSGGTLLDKRGAPIQTFEEVEMIVARGEYTLSITAIRKRPSE